MKVKVTKGSNLVVVQDGKSTEYKGGDTLDLTGEDLEVQLNAGIVEKVDTKKAPAKKGKK